MDIRYRHEWKHVINYADLLTIRTRMRAVARSDPHAIDGKYLIRSLYFDNIDDKALREKIDGVNMREKFRIRTYKTIKGKSFYSSWSKAKATKLKQTKKTGKIMKKTIKTVAIMGAGAVGAYVIYGLQDKYKENLWVIAKGKRAEKLKKQGLIINDVPYTLHVKTPQEARGVDLLVVCLKYGNLQGALKDIQEAAGPNTTILSIMNGVDTEDIIAQVVLRKQIIHSLIRIASYHQGNRITFPVPEGDMGIFYGLPEIQAGMNHNRILPERIERLEAVKDCMEGTKIVSHQSNEILKEIWKKFGLNISFNIPQAIISAGTGIYFDSQHAAFLCRALCKEVVALAESYGIIITVPEIIAGVHPDAVPNSSRFSTLQDLDAKRPTEIDMFCGTVMRLGQEQGIPVPYNTFAYHTIKALEEKNAGKFEY